MFSLADDDLKKRILGCGDGPACFNATMHRMGNNVVLVDPLYQCSTEQIRGRIQEVYPTILEQLVANQSAYVWTTISSIEELGQIRMKAMEKFLADFDLGKAKDDICPRTARIAVWRWAIRPGPMFPSAIHLLRTVVCGVPLSGCVGDASGRQGGAGVSSA